MKYRDLIKILERDGWLVVRVAGSHIQYRNPQKSGTITVPGGGRLGKDVPRDVEQYLEAGGAQPTAAMKYIVVIERADDGSYSAYVPDLPGCVSCGDTEDEARRMIEEAVVLHIESLRQHGETVPPPTARTHVVDAA